MTIRYILKDLIVSEQKNSNMKIFISAPFSNDVERKNNDRLAKRLEGNSFEVFLSQRDGVAKESRENKRLDNAQRLSTLIAESRSRINEADIIVFVTYGYALSDLQQLELGIAYATKTKAIAGLIQESNTGFIGKNFSAISGVVFSYVTDDEYMLVNYCKRVLTNPPLLDRRGQG